MINPQLAAEQVETAPQVDEPQETEQANVEEVEATESEESLELETDEAEERAFIPNDGMSERVRKRINQLTWEKHEAERQAQAKIQELEAKLSQQATTPAPATAEPTLAQFDYDDEKYSAALIDWKVEQRMAGIEQKLAATQQQTQAQQAGAQFADKQQAYAAEHADYVPLVQSMATAVHSKSVEQFIMSSDNGPKLHHHLLNNYPELARIQQLPDWQQGAELAKIETKLTQVKKKAPSKAPEPVKPLQTGKPVKPKTGGKAFPF